MGKLRSSLESLKKTVQAVEKKKDAAADESERFANNGQYAFDVVVAGIEVLAMYVEEKVAKVQKEQGRDISKDPFLADKDANVIKFAKEIVAGRERAAKLLNEWHAFNNGDLVSLGKDLDNISDAVMDIDKQIVKKKKKWIQSKKYKSKIQGYEDMLKELKKGAEAVKSEMGQFKQVEYSRKALETLKIEANSTNEEVSVKGGRNLATLKANVKKEIENGTYAPKKWRQQHFASALTMIGKWVGEAEEMEAESED